MSSPGVRVAVGHSDLFESHRVDEAHPERPARSRAVADGVARLGARVERYAVRPATRAEIEAVHHPRYVDEIAATAVAPAPIVFDEDTVAGPGTYAAALLSAGAAVAAVDAIFDGGVTRAFSLGRPPGHHAEVDRAMGFCFFNSVAVAAQHALDRHGCRRVAVVDWDVHHGNGTQRAFEGRRDVLFVSSHQYKLFPGSGHYTERGRAAGLGFTVNLPLSYQADDDELLALHRAITAPVLAAFAPDLLLISAGFDAHELDAAGEQRITAHGFARLAALLFDVADRVCQGRAVLVLEGGYHLDGLADSVAAVLDAALDPAAFRAEHEPAPTGRLAALLDGLVTLHEGAWPTLRSSARAAPPA